MVLYGVERLRRIVMHICKTQIKSISRGLIREGKNMSVSYNGLWKLLIDRELMKKDLCEMAGISSASMAKLGKNENVNTDIILRICVALQCDICDIMEIEKD